jgi:hypothetical protein
LASQTALTALIGGADYSLWGPLTAAVVSSPLAETLHL